MPPLFETVGPPTHGSILCSLGLIQSVPNVRLTRFGLIVVGVAECLGVPWFIWLQFFAK